jgi:hypothetical protein
LLALLGAHPFLHVSRIRVNVHICNCKGENIVKWIKGWVTWREWRRIGCPNDLHSRTRRGETKRKTQEKMERRSGKKSSSVGSEKMERVGDR